MRSLMDMSLASGVTKKSNGVIKKANSVIKKQNLVEKVEIAFQSF